MVSLLELLRSGGYILYARHGEATVGEDQPTVNFYDCATQRNLSELGRNQAIYYGRVLRALQIPISSPVVTSPFCRTIETGALAFGNQNIQVDPFWINIYNLSQSQNQSNTGKEKILKNLQSILEIKPPNGLNNVIIAHSFPKGVGLDDIPYMGTVIVKPKGPSNGYEVIARLSLADFYKIATTK
ncbi:histidine phosphatase family protein [Ureibacillus sp. NPDC094379]